MRPNRGTRLIHGVLMAAVGLCVWPQSAAAQPSEATYESLTVADTAVGLTSTTYRPTGAPQMATCLARLETAELRYRLDGTAPTSGEGMLLEPGDTLVLHTNSEMASAKFIRTTSTSGVLKVTCWRQARTISGGAGALVGALPAGTNNIGDVDVLSVITGTGATNLGKAEDSAHTSGDTGVAILGVRKDGAAQTTNADGDHADVAVDAYSALFARSDHPNRIRCNVTTSTAVVITAVGGQCVPPGAGLSIYITDVLFSASAAGIAADAHPTLKSGTGGTCGVGTEIVWQALTAAAIVVQDNMTTPIKLTANNELCWISTTAGSKAIVIRGYIAP